MLETNGNGRGRRKTVSISTSGRPRRISGAAVLAILEEKVQRRLGMTADEFIRRMREGTLPDDPAIDELAILVGGSQD